MRHPHRPILPRQSNNGVACQGVEYLPHGPRRRRVEVARRALSERAFQDVAKIEKPALSEAVRRERGERPN
jgi:hypothetical protein